MNCLIHITRLEGRSANGMPYFIPNKKTFDQSNSHENLVKCMVIHLVDGKNSIVEHLQNFSSQNVLNTMA